ncbi:hypothetical protein [Nonomuraea diastatica]|nr:hypothetical protein [Nonomuraea diastatica]
MIEGRCPVCRASRERVHQHGFAGLSPAVVVALLVVLLFVSLVLNHLFGV